MFIFSTIRRRIVGIAAALAIGAGVSAVPAAAQTQPEVKKAPTKINQSSKSAQRGSTGVNPRPAANSGLQIPEPTVVLKAGEVPAIRFDQPDFDFGRIRAGDDVIHDYWFTNTGTGPLEILRVKPSCGCTTAGPHTRIVQPGETGKIPIKLSTKKGGSTLSKTVTVNTNVPGKDATIRLTIHGSVWQPVDVTPTNAAFGRLSQAKVDSDMERRLTLVNNVEAPMTLTNVRCDNPRFAAEVKPLEPGKKYELIVKLVPPLLEGNNRGTIKIDTGLSDYPTVDVSAFAYLTAPVDITPSSLTLVPGRTASMKRQFYVRSNDGKNFEIKNLSCSSDKLSLSTTSVGSSATTHQVVVEIPADYAPAAGEKIQFETTHPAAATMSIPITNRATRRTVTPTAKTPAQATPGSAAVQVGKNPTKPATMPEAADPAKPAAPVKETDKEKKKTNKPQEMTPVGQ